jgi:hypothetical protein
MQAKELGSTLDAPERVLDLMGYGADQIDEGILVVVFTVSKRKILRQGKDRSSYPVMGVQGREAEVHIDLSAQGDAHRFSPERAFFRYGLPDQGGYLSLSGDQPRKSFSRHVFRTFSEEFFTAFIDEYHSAVPIKKDNRFFQTIDD